MMYVWCQDELDQTISAPLSFQSAGVQCNFARRSFDQPPRRIAVHLLDPPLDNISMSRCQGYLKSFRPRNVLKSVIQ